MNIRLDDTHLFNLAAQNATTTLWPDGVDFEMGIKENAKPLQIIYLELI